MEKHFLHVLTEQGSEHHLAAAIVEGAKAQLHAQGHAQEGVPPGRDPF